MQWAMRNYRQLAFVMEAGHDVDPYIYNSRGLQETLKTGILYTNKKMKYWIDDTSSDCFALYARALTIINSDRPGYWRWLTDTANGNVEVAMAVDVKWLEVRGSFWTMRLSPNADYQVCFRVKLEPSTNMKGKTVKVRLSLPNGTTQESFQELPKDANIEGDLVVGTFTMTNRTVGRMDFAMEQTDGESKKGLVIKAVEIKTRQSN